MAQLLISVAVLATAQFYKYWIGMCMKACVPLWWPHLQKDPDIQASPDEGAQWKGDEKHEQAEVFSLKKRRFRVGCVRVDLQVQTSAVRVA